MSLINSLRKGCADVFNAFLVSTAKYAGFWEFPRIDATRFIPNRVIPFSKAVSKSLRILTAGFISSRTTAGLNGYGEIPESMSAG